MSINLLKHEDYKTALNLLRKSENLCENNDYGKSMTYNNLACYYRKYFNFSSLKVFRIGKLRTALQYLEKALDIEQ